MEPEGHLEEMNVSGVGKSDIGKGNVVGGIQFAIHVTGKDTSRRNVIKGPGNGREAPGAWK